MIVNSNKGGIYIARIETTEEKYFNVLKEIKRMKAYKNYENDSYYISLLKAKRVLETNLITDEITYIQNKASQPLAKYK